MPLPSCDPAMCMSAPTERRGRILGGPTSAPNRRPRMDGALFCAAKWPAKLAKRDPARPTWLNSLPAVVSWSVVSWSNGQWALTGQSRRRENAIVVDSNAPEHIATTINALDFSSIGRALARQSRGSGFGSPECHIYRVTVWLKTSTANRGKRMLALLRWSTIKTLVQIRCFATFARTGVGGWCDPPWRFQTKRCRTSRKRPADCSRWVLAIGGIICDPRSIFNPVMAGQWSNFPKFHDFSTSRVDSIKVIYRSGMKPSPACSPFNSAQNEVFWCISVEY